MYLVSQHRPTITCPAGSYHEKNGLAGVFCGVEDRFLAVRYNPRTVVGWCSGDHTRCPSWQADKERDPGVDAAQGRPRMVRCPDCLGSGIQQVEKFRSGLWFPDEEPCDGCAGSGRVIWVRDEDG